MNILSLEHIYSIRELPSRYEYTCFSADFNGQLIIMGVKKISKKTFRYDIYHFNNEEIQKYTISTIKSFHHIQRLYDSWLLADARAEDEKVQNATIFDDYGTSIISFHLGDGIENLQVSENGDIWVGYFDEGVYGDTVGGSGLSCFNSNGEQVFDFSDFSLGKKDIPIIDDCYALNVVSNDDIYCYYYSDFPLLNLKNMRDYRVFNELIIQGSKAFAVWRDHILFGPTYNNDKVYLYSLRDKCTITYKPVNENGKILKDFEVVGRKSIMYLIDEKDIYRIDLRLLIK
ncbi:hypothetical protein LIT25_18550 [Bacillus sp. F19]|nr:hypothetical protein LIT25_18550 [Bacillus sp. F19]